MLAASGDGGAAGNERVDVPAGDVPAGDVLAASAHLALVVLQSISAISM